MSWHQQEVEIPYLAVEKKNVKIVFNLIFRLLTIKETTNREMLVTGRKSNFHPAIHCIEGVYAKLFVIKLPLRPIDIPEY